jgi:hypothetical protein
MSRDARFKKERTHGFHELSRIQVAKIRTIHFENILPNEASAIPRR